MIDITDLSKFYGKARGIEFLTDTEEIALLEQFDGIGELNRFILGLNAGSGIDFHFGKLIVGAVFDYYFSLNKLVENKSEWGVTNTISPKAITLNANVGYKL